MHADTEQPDIAWQHDGPPSVDRIASPHLRYECSLFSKRKLANVRILGLRISIEWYVIPLAEANDATRRRNLWKEANI